MSRLGVVEELGVGVEDRSEDIDDPEGGGGSRRRALVGDNLAQRAVDNGWAGIVVYGCIRDAHQIDGIAIGIKALGTHPRKTEKRGEGRRDVEVRFGGVTIRPGDHVYADRDGVVVLRG